MRSRGPGRLKGELSEWIVFCAHYDSKIDTSGVYDNAAGAGVLLTLAEILSQRRHRDTLEWVACTGEEGAGLRDMEYARNARSDGNGFDQVTAPSISMALVRSLGQRLPRVMLPLRILKRFLMIRLRNIRESYR